MHVKMKRSLKYLPLSFNEDDMTVECVYASETPYDRGEFIEVLSITTDAIDTTRLDSKAVPLIWNHEWNEPRIVGRIVDHRIEAGQAVAVIQLSRSSYSQGTVQDIKDGVIKNVSVGYDVLDYEDEAGQNGGKVIRRVRRWMPFEISIVGIPADHTAQFRSADMTKSNNKQSNKRADDVTEVTETPATDLVASIENAQVKIDEAIATLLDLLSPEAEAEVEVDEAVTEEVRSRAIKIQGIATRALSASASQDEVDDAVQFAIDELQKVRDSLSVDDEDEDEDEDEAATVSGETAAERSRVASVTYLCRSFRVSDDDTMKMIKNGTSVEGARKMIKDKKVARSAGALRSSGAEVITDRAETKKRGLAAALYSRLSGKPVEDVGREFRGLSLREMAREVIGPSSRSMNDERMFHTLTRSFGAHTSSDLGFTSALGDAINLRLRDAYGRRENRWEPIVSRTTVSNFMPQNIIGSGTFPSLKRIPEHAEIEFGTAVGDSGTFQIGKYGSAIAFTFEAFINDNLRYIERMIRETGQAVYAFEDSLIFNALTDNAVRSDGVATFAAARGNLIGEALDVQGLSVAQTALLTQTDYNGEPMSLQGSVLIVGPQLSLAAQRLITPVVATEISGVNPFSSVLQNVIVDPRISGDDWYLTSGQDADTVELAYLDGHEGIQVEEQWDPRISATAYYAKAYAGAALTGWRGFVKSTGANEVEG